MVRRKKGEDKEEIGGTIKGKFEDLHGILNGSEKVVHGLSGAYHSAKHLVGGAIHHHHHHHHHYHGESGGDIWNKIGDAFDPKKNGVAKVFDPNQNGINKSAKNVVNDLKSATQYAIPAITSGIGGVLGAAAGTAIEPGMGSFIGGVAGSAGGAYAGHELNKALHIQNNKDFSGKGMKHKTKMALTGLLGGVSSAAAYHHFEKGNGLGCGIKPKRKSRFEKGSAEAKEFMQKLRDARKK